MSKGSAKKLRNTLNKISFYEGQIVQLEEKISSDLKEKIKIYTDFKDNKVNELNNILNTKDLNEQKREQKINKLVDKQYWQTRRYKQKYKNSQELTNILKELASTQELELSNLKGEVLIKYPLKEIDNNLKEKLTNKIDVLEKTHEERVLKLEEDNKKVVEKLSKRIDVIKDKINVLKEKETTYSSLIKDENDKLLNEYKDKLPLIYEEIDALDVNLNILKETDKEYKKLLKKKNKATSEADTIKAYIEANENKEIHLAISNLKMHFGGIKALDGVSFEVKKGEIFGLIGPNGAGKTTVFNCITQFYKATAGTAFFDNKEGNITNLMKVKVHNIIKEGIARSFQNIEMVWELSVLDNLLVAAHSIIMSDYLGHMVHSRKMKKEEDVLRIKGMQILEMLGILEYAFRSPYGLPYGVLKKIELARTLMTNPTMIILDEPAAGLNDIETKDLALTIKKINEELNVTIFLVEHDMQLVMSICDTICAINFGKMLAIGTPTEIQNNALVRKAYLGED